MPDERITQKSHAVKHQISIPQCRNYDAQCTMTCLQCNQDPANECFTLKPSAVEQTYTTTSGYCREGLSACKMDIPCEECSNWKPQAPAPESDTTATNVPNLKYISKFEHNEITQRLHTFYQNENKDLQAQLAHVKEKKAQRILELIVQKQELQAQLYSIKDQNECYLNEVNNSKQIITELKAQLQAKDKVIEQQGFQIKDNFAVIDDLGSSELKLRMKIAEEDNWYNLRLKEKHEKEIEAKDNSKINYLTITNDKLKTNIELQQIIIEKYKKGIEAKDQKIARLQEECDRRGRIIKDYEKITKDAIIVKTKGVEER